MKRKLLINMKTCLAVAAGLACAMPASNVLSQGLVLSDTLTTSVGGGEILSFDTLTKRAFGTYYTDANNFGVEYATISGAGTFGALSQINFDSYFDTNFASFGAVSVSSVAIDPLGRGFGVAAVIPTLNLAGTDLATTWQLGKLVTFNTTSGSILGSYDIGYHPDSVTFTPDGNKILVANEAEQNTNNVSQPAMIQAPGSISILDVSTVTPILDFTGVGPASTIDFTTGSPSLVGIRDYNVPMNTATTSASVENLEPEYIAVSGNKAYVTLQENNAIGVFDLTTNQWDSVKSLGKHIQTVDASDRDGPGNANALNVNDPVTGLPMPDAVGAFTVGGKTYLVTANEGDAAPDRESPASPIDEQRVKNIPVADAVTGNLDPTYSGTLDKTDDGLGRLNVSIVDGDLDGDGDIDDLVMYGTRSFSVWDADTMTRVFDSNQLDFGGGAFGIEQWIVANDAANWINSGRDDNKGPEPEGITLGTIDGDIYAFVGLERSNHVMMFKLLDQAASDFAPGDVAFLDAYAMSGLVSPEGLTFISAADSPTGNPMLLVGYEISGSWAAYTVPEPSSAVLLLGGLAFLVNRRRRRAA